MQTFNSYIASIVLVQQLRDRADRIRFCYPDWNAWRVAMAVLVPWQIARALQATKSIFFRWKVRDGAFSRVSDEELECANYQGREAAMTGATLPDTLRSHWLLAREWRRGFNCQRLQTRYDEGVQYMREMAETYKHIELEERQGILEECYENGLCTD